MVFWTRRWHIYWLFCHKIGKFQEETAATISILNWSKTLTGNKPSAQWLYWRKIAFHYQVIVELIRCSIDHSVEDGETIKHNACFIIIQPTNSHRVFVNICKKQYYNATIYARHGSPSLLMFLSYLQINIGQYNKT